MTPFSRRKAEALIREREREERGGEREKHRCERDTSIGRLLHAPCLGLGFEPATQVRALAQNRTQDPSVCGLTLAPETQARALALLNLQLCAPVPPAHPQASLCRLPVQEPGHAQGQAELQGQEAPPTP